MDNFKKDVALTGDRPTGKLHIGHYVGSLKNRVKLQNEGKYQNYIMIADMQALTDNAENPEKVRSNILEVTYDYLACGIDPEKTTIFIQSQIPELCELTFIYLNYVTLARLKRNPTVKTEMNLKGFGDTVPAGFLIYPVSQAADITAFNTKFVPVGDDQLPMIEQCNEIARHINNLFGKEILTEASPLLSNVSRLPGTDGQEKMGKSLGNAIYLADDADTVKKKIMGMYTDPNHLRVEDPGDVEHNPVFKYLDAFDPEKDELREWKEHYKRGGLGDVKVKRRLIDVMQATLEPIRQKRMEVSGDPEATMKMLLSHSKKARAVASETLKRLRDALKLNY